MVPSVFTFFACRAKFCDNPNVQNSFVRFPCYDTKSAVCSLGQVGMRLGRRFHTPCLINTTRKEYVGDKTSACPLTFCMLLSAAIEGDDRKGKG